MGITLDLPNILRDLEAVIVAGTALLVAIETLWTRHVRRDVKDLKNGELTAKARAAVHQALNEREHGKTE
jgi:hypothetical protein